MQSHNTMMSASSLSGNKVTNTNGEKLGKIEDFMVNTADGHIEYAVLSFGGFLGLGDKLFAIPMSALNLDTSDKEFILNVDKEKLENAPGFDKDHWPDMASPEWRTSINDYYLSQSH